VKTPANSKPELNVAVDGHIKIENIIADMGCVNCVSSIILIIGI
jgi:hypothetical protein